MTRVVKEMPPNVAKFLEHYNPKGKREGEFTKQELKEQLNGFREISRRDLALAIKEMVVNGILNCRTGSQNVYYYSWIR